MKEIQLVFIKKDGAVIAVVYSLKMKFVFLKLLQNIGKKTTVTVKADKPTKIPL
jgi:hypothetical protein